jgi:hypothetical protein
MKILAPAAVVAFISASVIDVVSERLNDRLAGTLFSSTAVLLSAVTGVLSVKYFADQYRELIREGKITRVASDRPPGWRERYLTGLAEAMGINPTLFGMREAMGINPARLGLTIGTYTAPLIGALLGPIFLHNPLLYAVAGSYETIVGALSIWLFNISFEARWKQFVHHQKAEAPQELPENIKPTLSSSSVTQEFALDMSGSHERQILTAFGESPLDPPLLPRSLRNDVIAIKGKPVYLGGGIHFHSDGPGTPNSKASNDELKNEAVEKLISNHLQTYTKTPEEIIDEAEALIEENQQSLSISAILELKLSKLLNATREEIDARLSDYKNAQNEWQRVFDKHNPTVTSTDPEFTSALINFRKRMGYLPKKHWSA